MARVGVFSLHKSGTTETTPQMESIMTINLTRDIGINFRRMRGSDNKMYVCAIGWFPISPTTLRHFHFSFRSF
jgi:hypothetical protein